jgi:hypothetical protein
MRSDSRWFPALYPPKIQLLHISFQGSPNNHPAFCPLSSYTALAHDGILLYMWRERVHWPISSWVCDVGLHG